MRWKYVSMVFIISFFLLSAVRTKAQSSSSSSSDAPTPSYAIPSPLPSAPIDLAVPGFNCGNSLDTANGTNKCCYNKPVSPKLIDWGWPFDSVANIINNALTDRLNPIIALQRQVKTEPCQVGTPSIPGDLGNPACVCEGEKIATLSAILPLCNRINPNSKANGGSEQAACVACLTGSNGVSGVWTSVGCVSGNLSDFIEKTLLGWGIGLAGGISMLCIMYAAFMMQSSQGNAESIKKAQQLLTSCIMGLMLAIFSVFILKLIGVDILKIPGFSR